MKSIEGMAEKVKIIPASEKEDLSKLEIPTVRMVILNSVANARGFSGEKAVRLTKMGLALMVSGNDILLEDADYDLLKEVLNGVQQPYTSFIMGQAINVVANAKEQEAKK